MKIATFGVRGNIGRRIAEEALRRGHEVTAVLRDPAAELPLSHPRLSRATGDALSAESVARAAAGHDVVASAVAPDPADAQQLVSMARALVEGTRLAGVPRLVFVGGAGSLEVAPGLQAVDTPDFPAFLRPIALAHRDALEALRASAIDWTYVSPPFEIVPGERTGKLRLGLDQALFDAQGRSWISMEDYAIAFVDEIEQGAHRRARFTVGY